MKASLIWHTSALALTLSVGGGGFAWAGPPRPVDRASPTTGPDGSPLSADDLKELEAMQKAVGEFESASKTYRGTVSHIVKQEYEKKRHELQARYDDQIKNIEKDEKARRADAIALFERFLAKYPNDRRWTPDVIFRLAELYFERANEEYLAAVDAAQKAADAASKDPNNANNAAAATPAPVTPDYQKTIDLYKHLISNFPDYRLIDGAEYLLGYCLGEMNKEAEARQAYLALACMNKYKALDPPPPPAPTKAKGEVGPAFVDPYKECKAIKEDSRFVPEAWTRIGEYHFDYNELELAIAAYARVLTYKDSPYFDKALYKLAWSYYRADKYPDAIKKFDELVVYSDTKKNESGKEGSDLRQEAVQYLGISFAEKDWNGDSIDDPETGLQRIESFYRGRDNEDHVRDIYVKLGDIYFDETEYLRAIEVYKRLLDKWPYHPDNPKVQDKIVLCLERMRNFEAALAARGELAKKFGKGTEWRKKNQDNKEAIDTANELAEQALVKFAVDHHKAAQALKKLALATNPPDGKKLELASKEYSQAADGYEKYLEQYTNSKNTYEYTFFYAESLYYSTRFAEAATQYEKVRDSELDNKYLEDSAFNAVKSYENLLDGQIKNGRLKYPPTPEVGKVQVTPSADGRTNVVAPLTIPDDVKKIQAAYDAFVAKVPASGRIATMAYKAAEIDFKYLHFEDARKRMEDVLAKYCKDDVSRQAGAAILASYAIENNLDKIVEWTDKVQNSQCGDKSKIDTGAIKTLQADTKFKIADRLYADKKFEDAAAAYIKLVDADPSNKSGNNDKALNNAAVCYEQVQRPASATKIYERIVNEYPKSPFVDDALFRTAVNYARFFEFDKAVVSYQRLATDPRFKDSKNRTNSMFNAAVILENDQNYDQSAKLYQAYSKDPSLKPEERADAYFHSGLIYLKNKDASKTLSTFRTYLKEYGTDPKKVIEANYHIQEACELSKDKQCVESQQKKLIALGSSVAPASDGAEYAAKAEFLAAEKELPTLEKMKLSAKPKEFAASLKKFREEVQRLQAEYTKILNYRRATWTIAAYFRIGYVEELLSKALAALLQAPCPPDVAAIQKKQERLGAPPEEFACQIYSDQLTQKIEPEVAKVDDDVVKKYQSVLDNAAKLGVSNDWTKLTRSHAHDFKPEQFPNIKDEHVDMQMEAP
jgi:tetratricopeptide (TPR) repeat protein